MKEAKAPQPTIVCRRENLLDSATTALRLGVARQTLNSWRNKNYGPGFFLMGRKVVYDPSEVDFFIQQRRRTRTGTTDRNA